MGDFNGDGRQDLATANRDASTVSILLGQGDGTFQAASDVGVGMRPVSVTVGDFNGDGRQDLAAASQPVSILLGQGDGTFQAALDVEGTPAPVSITVGDFDGDGRQDLATTNNNLAIGVSIVLGQGDGTFQALLTVVEGFGPVSITVGDFNGDGRQDLATGNAAGHDARSVFILINIGMGVSDLVTFDPIPSTFTFTPDPTGCPEGFVGTFHFEARLTNSRARSLLTLVVQVITLTQGNLLQNADGGPGGVSTGLTVPQQDGFTDGVLSPDESVDVPFIICLTQQRRFTLVVDVFGEVE